MKEVTLDLWLSTLDFGISLCSCQESGHRAEREPAIITREMVWREGDSLKKENGM